MQRKHLKLLKRKSVREDGMTLIEILAVVVLLGLILAVVARNIFGQSEAARARLNELRMEKVKNSIAQFRLQYGQYPSAMEDLIRQPSSVKDSGMLYIPLADKEEIKDIWNNEYLYKLENNGRSYSLSSLGSDGIEGGEGAAQDVTKRP